MHYRKHLFAIVTEQNEVYKKIKKAVIIGAIFLAVIFISFNEPTAGGLSAPLAHSGDFISNCPGINNQWLKRDYDEQSRGPAPSSGDGIPEGPGW